MHDIPFEGDTKIYLNNPVDIYRWFWSHRIYHDENSKINVYTNPKLFAENKLLEVEIVGQIYWNFNNFDHLNGPTEKLFLFTHPKAVHTIVYFLRLTVLKLFVLGPLYPLKNYWDPQRALVYVGIMYIFIFTIKKLKQKIP